MSYFSFFHNCAGLGNRFGGQIAIRQPQADHFLLAAKMGRAHGGVMARKLAEALNEFVHALSLRSWAFLVAARESVSGLVGTAAGALDFVLPARASAASDSVAGLARALSACSLVR